MADDIFGIVGSVIAGAYRVEAVVAEGGFGVVYRAHHAGFRAPVALKCLKIPQQIGPTYQAEFLEQFRAEAELLFRLSASIPTVVRPLHVDAVTVENGTFVPFMALEWLEGETLEAIVAERRIQRRPPLSLKKLIRLLTPVARALERAHNFTGPDGPVSIVHRDLKPENIFVARVAGDEVVKILDFGIGKAKSVVSQVAGRASQTQSSLSSFTPAYGAPEQWLPKRYGQTGPWTDVWGLALTLVEAMAGHPILDGDHAAMMGTAVDPVRRPTPRNEGVTLSDAIERVFERALAVDPRDRYAHAGLFWNALVEAAGLKETRGDRPAFRDARADGAIVPRLETIEAAVPERRARISGIESLNGEHAETLAADAALLGGGELSSSGSPAGMSWPPAVNSNLPLSPPVRDPGPSLVIPDLTTSDESPTSRRSRASLPSSSLASELDLEENGHPGVELALDLEPHERPERRISRPSLRAVTGPGVEAGALQSRDSAPVSGPAPLPPVRGRMDSGRISRPSAPGRISASPGEGPVSGFEAVSVPNPEPSRGRERHLVRKLLPGAALILTSILLTLAEQMVAASTGHIPKLGPVRSSWIAVGLMLSGIALVIYRLLPRSE